MSAGRNHSLPVKVPAERRIYRLGVICLALTMGAFFAPGLIPGKAGGFSGVAEALLVLLGLLLIALALSVYLLVFALNRYRDISKPARIVGLLPFAVRERQGRRRIQ